MILKNMRLFVLLLVLPAIFLGREILADTGPKPSMDFSFKDQFPGQPLTIASGTLFECEQSDCSDAAPLKRLGPQGFSCTETNCSALAYGFSTYHRLAITFSDGKTRQSNIFKTTQFQAEYQVTVRQDDLLVESKFNLNLFTPLTYILLCSGCLVGIAILVIGIVLLRRRATKKM